MTKLSSTGESALCAATDPLPLTRTAAEAPVRSAAGDDDRQILRKAAERPCSQSLDDKFGMQRAGRFDGLEDRNDTRRG